MVVLAALLLVATGVSAEPSNPTGWGEEFRAEIRRGDEHYQALEFARALENYERAEKLAPHAFIGFYKSALALYRWGDAVPVRRQDLWPQALQKADRARFLDPVSSDAVFLAGVLRYRMGDFKAATEVYKSLEKVRQGDVDLYLDLAVAAWRAGDMDLAMASLERARTVAPSSRRLQSVAREILRLR